MKNPENTTEKVNVIMDIDILGMGLMFPKARTGVYRVTEEILKRLVEEPDVEMYYSASSNLPDVIEYIKENNYITNPRFVHSENDIKRGKFWANFIHFFAWFPLLMRLVRRVVFKIFYRKPVPLVNFPANPVYFSTYRPIPDGVKGNPYYKKVLLIHDLIAFRLPKLFDDSNRMDVYNAIESVDDETTIVCVSKSTKKDLLTFFPKLRNQVKVIPLAANLELFHMVPSKATIDHALRKYNIPNRPYILSLSTLEPRKNIETTIRAFGKMLRDHHEINTTLVLVGTLGWQYEGIFAEIAQAGVLKSHLIVTGYIDDEDLAAIYTGATGFVYPSLYEGFGLPPLEAMQCGVPVIVSNTSSIPEVVGDAGILVDPLDKIAIKDAMEKLLTDRAFHNELSDKSLEQAAKFSWEKSVDKYVAIFKKISKENSSTEAR